MTDKNFPFILNITWFNVIFVKAFIIMKKINVVLAILVVLIANSAISKAQSVTAPVGYVKYSIGVGLNAVGISLINPDIVKATVTSKTSTSITLDGQSSIGSLLTPDEPYYVEGYSGDSKGERFDVDCPSTIAAGNAIVLSVNSVNNSQEFNMGSVGIGDIVALRKQVTIKQLQDSVEASTGTGWVGSDDPSSADQIMILDPVQQSFAIYYLRANGTTWRALSGRTDFSKSPIAAGRGIFVDKKEKPVNIIFVGGVRDNDFATPYYAGYDLKASPIPMDFSPTSIGATQQNSWTGSDTFTTADQIMIFDSANQNFGIYYLRADGTTWRSTSDRTNYKDSPLITSAGVYLVNKMAGDIGQVLNNPLPKN